MYELDAKATSRRREGRLRLQVPASACGYEYRSASIYGIVMTTAGLACGAHDSSPPPPPIRSQLARHPRSQLARHPRVFAGLSQNQSFRPGHCGLGTTISHRGYTSVECEVVGVRARAYCRYRKS